MLFLFFIFAYAEMDCYYANKDVLLNTCVLPADTNHDNVLNATEIDNYCTMYQLTGWNSYKIFLMTNKTELTMTDWNSLSESAVLSICFLCQYKMNLMK
jgi:hypothetical protein